MKFAGRKCYSNYCTIQLKVSIHNWRLHFQCPQMSTPISSQRDNNMNSQTLEREIASEPQTLKLQAGRVSLTIVQFSSKFQFTTDAWILDAPKCRHPSISSKRETTWTQKHLRERDCSWTLNPNIAGIQFSSKFQFTSDARILDAPKCPHPFTSSQKRQLPELRNTCERAIASGP